MIIFLSASFGRRFLKHSVFLFFGCQKHSPSMAFGKHNSLDGSCWWWPVFQHNKQSIFASLVAKIEDRGPQPKALKKYTRHWNRPVSRRLLKGCFFDDKHQATSDFCEMKGFFTKTSKSQGLACYFQAGEGMFWMKWWQGRGHHL